MTNEYLQLDEVGAGWKTVYHKDGHSELIGTFKAIHTALLRFRKIYELESDDDLPHIQINPTTKLGFRDMNRYDRNQRNKIHKAKNTPMKKRVKYQDLYMEGLKRMQGLKNSQDEPTDE